MKQEQLLKAFAATVQASLHGLHELEAVLRRERDALGSHDPAMLTAVVEEKLAKLKALEPSVTARDRMQQLAGFATGIDGGSTLVSRLGDSGLEKEWQQLTELAAQVANLNDINARIVAQTQRTTRSALELLTGRPQRDITYSDLRRRSSLGTAKHLLGTG